MVPAASPKEKEWRDRILECRNSGLSVRQWCQEQQISFKTYYKWEKIILAKAIEEMGKTENSSIIEFVELEPPTDSIVSQSCLTATVKMGNIAVDVYKGADMKAISSLCQELSHA